MKTTNNTILITGGGGGIGRGLAEAFHALGNQVIIVGLQEAKLAETVAANPGMASYVLDVRDPEAVREVAAKVIEAFPALNVLINNAGIMRAENLLEGEATLVHLESTVDTNLLGPIRLVAATLPHLLTQGDATIVNVGSVLAHVPLTIVPSYSASKAAVHSWTQSLRYQLRDSGVEVLEIIPPAVHTGLTGSDEQGAHEMPLPEFIDQLMDLFVQQPVSKELCVPNAKPTRLAESSGRYEEEFLALNKSIAL